MEMQTCTSAACALPLAKCKDNVVLPASLAGTQGSCRTHSAGGPGSQSSKSHQTYCEIEIVELKKTLVLK